MFSGRLFRTSKDSDVQFYKLLADAGYKEYDILQLREVYHRYHAVRPHEQMKGDMEALSRAILPFFKRNNLFNMNNIIALCVNCHVIDKFAEFCLDDVFGNIRFNQDNFNSIIAISKGDADVESKVSVLFEDILTRQAVDDHEVWELLFK